jgi:hypothetical protein
MKKIEGHTVFLSYESIRNVLKLVNNGIFYSLGKEEVWKC